MEKINSEDYKDEDVIIGSDRKEDPLNEKHRLHNDLFLLNVETSLDCYYKIASVAKEKKLVSVYDETKETTFYTGSNTYGSVIIDATICPLTIDSLIEILNIIKNDDHFNETYEKEIAVNSDVRKVRKMED